MVSAKISSRPEVTHNLQLWIKALQRPGEKKHISSYRRDAHSRLMRTKAGIPCSTHLILAYALTEHHVVIYRNKGDHVGHYCLPLD